MQTKNAIGNLVSRYKSVLKKCNLLNTFGSLAVVGMLTVGAGIGGAVVGSGIEAGLNVSAGTSFVSQAMATEDTTTAFSGSGMNWTVNSGTYSNGTQYYTSGSTGATYTFVGTTNVSGDLTFANTSTLKSAESATGTLNVTGWLTETDPGSDFSGITIILNNPDSDYYGGLVLANSLTVGNVTFNSGSYLQLYNVSTQENSTSTSKTLTTTSGNTVTFSDAYISNKTSGDGISNVTINGEGTVAFSGSTTIYSGIVTLDSGVTLDNSNGTIVINAENSYGSELATATNTGLTLEGTKTNAGIITVTDGTLTNNGTLTNSGTITVDSGSFLINTGTIANEDSGNLTINSGATLTNSGIITGDVTNNGTSIIASGATVTGEYTNTTGESTLTGATLASGLIVSGGTVNITDSTTVDGDTTVSSGATINVSNSTLASTTIENGGTATVTGTSNSVSELNTSGGAVLQIGSTDTDGAGVAGALELTSGSLAGTTLVGTSVANALGSLVLSDSATLSGTLFVDPAWVTGQTSYDTSYASQVAIESVSNINSGAEIVAGQAAQIVIGSTNTSWVANAIDSVDDLTWGSGDGEISSAIGLAVAVNLTDIDGSSGSADIVADGTLTLLGDGETTYDGTNETTSGTYYTGTVDDYSDSSYDTNYFSGGTATFASGSLLIVDVTGTGSTTEGSYALTASKLSVAESSSLLLSNVGALTDGETTVNVATASASGDSWAGWATSGDGTNIYYDSAFLTTSEVTNNVSGSSVEVTVKQVSSTEVLPLLNSSLGSVIDTGIGAGTLPDFIENASKMSDKKQSAATIEGAAKIAVSAGVMNTASNITGLGVNNIQNRTSLIATGTSSNLTANSGVLVASNDNYGSDMYVAAVGDMAGLGGMKNGVGVWLQPMYQSTSADGFKSGNFEYGYDTDLFGVSVGADYTFANSFRLGAALHMGTGDTESSSSDFNYTENDFDYFGFSLYGAYARDNFGLSADIGYTVTSNDVTQKTSVGNLYTGDFDASTFTAGVRAEYKVETSALDIIPHVGMRINYYDVDSFTTKDSTGDVYHSKSSDATTFSIPVGVSFSKDIETANGLTVTPRADVGVQFTMGDLDVDQKVAISGVSGTATMESEIFDPVTFMGGVGIDVAKDNLSFALDYNLGASSNVTNHQVMATFSYKF